MYSVTSVIVWCRVYFSLSLCPSWSKCVFAEGDEDSDEDSDEDDDWDDDEYNDDDSGTQEGGAAQDDSVCPPGQNCGGKNGRILHIFTVTINVWLSPVSPAGCINTFNSKF